MAYCLSHINMIYLSHPSSGYFLTIAMSMNIPLCNIFTPAGGDTRQFPVGVPPCPPPCHHIPQFQGCPCTSKAKIPQEMTLTYNPWPLQPPTLLIQPCFSPVVGWGWRAHYQVSVITPSHMLTALIYGDWGTCVHSVGVEFCMSIWIC